jgi:hypothetical protein
MSQLNLLKSGRKTQHLIGYFKMLNLTAGRGWYNLLGVYHDSSITLSMNKRSGFCWYLHWNLM